MSGSGDMLKKSSSDTQGWFRSLHQRCSERNHPWVSEDVKSRVGTIIIFMFFSCFKNIMKKSFRSLEKQTMKRLSDHDHFWGE